MADNSSEEKTEHATPRRLREARKKGQVPKSRDVSQILVMITTFVAIAMLLTFMGGEYKRYFQLCFETMAAQEIDTATLYDLCMAGLIAMGKTIGPVLVIGMFVGFIAGIMQVGAIFATEPVMPKFEKLNPIEGLKNMFKVVVLFELLKNIVKIGLILYLAYQTIFKSIDAILSTSKIDIFSSAKLTGDLLFSFLVKVSICFMIISLLDYALQRWNFMKNMRMSKDEVKREYKQDEGDPAIKGERRRLHREMAFGDVRKAVKKADAIVTNPIHVACVLEYNKDEMSAPTLTAKGQRQFAELIVEMAEEEGVPIIRNIPLAWSLLQLEIGDEIPEDLFDAVAEVLTAVYEMKRARENPNQPSA